MPSVRQVSYLAAATILGVSLIPLSAQAKEQDSAYQWGRWAVLSPAAGGPEPYVAVKTPGAEFNARPGDAEEFQPQVAGVGAEPGVGDVNPDIPVVTVPPTPPPPPPGTGDVNPGVPVVTVPPSAPPPPP